MFPGLDLYCSIPAQLLTTASEGLDYHYLSLDVCNCPNIAHEFQVIFSETWVQFYFTVIASYIAVTVGSSVAYVDGLVSSG